MNGADQLLLREVFEKENVSYAGVIVENYDQLVDVVSFLISMCKMISGNADLFLSHKKYVDCKSAVYCDGDKICVDYGGYNDNDTLYSVFCEKRELFYIPPIDVVHIEIL